MAFAFLREFLKLTRFEHAIMLAIAVIIGEIVALGGFPDFSAIVLLSLIVPVFSEMASFAMNDCLDAQTDKLNKKMTPIVRGAISKSFAMNFAWAAFAVSMAAAFLINFNALVIALVFNTLAIAYNYKLKDLPLVGNMYIGTTMAIPFIFGNFVVSGALNPTVLVLSLLGFISGLAREIIKSVQDMEGDKKARNSKTLPIIIGAKNAILLASLLYVIFIPLTFLPFLLFGLSQGIAAIALVSIADLMIIYMAFNLATKGDAKSLKEARKISLFALFLGLVGYLVASI